MAKQIAGGSLTTSGAGWKVVKRSNYHHPTSYFPLTIQRQTWYNRYKLVRFFLA